MIRRAGVELCAVYTQFPNLFQYVTLFPAADALKLPILA